MSSRGSFSGGSWGAGRLASLSGFYAVKIFRRPAGGSAGRGLRWSPRESFRQQQVTLLVQNAAKPEELGGADAHGRISGVVDYIAAGRPTFTSRTAGTAVDFIGANPNRPFLVYYSNNDTVFNEGRNNVSSMRTEGDGNPITDRSLVDFSVNHGGPGQDRESYFSVMSAFLEHQFSENTFMEVAFNHREHKFDFRDPRGPRRQFFGDPNALRDAFKEQARGLVDGGAELLVFTPDSEDA